VKILSRLAITCMVVAVAPAVSAADPLISPAAGSDAILSLRAQSQGELRLQYRKETSAAAAETISVGIASDYHYISTTDLTRIYDYKLHRILTTRSANSFVIDSLYADVWFRAMEAKNRVMLRRMLAGANVSTPKVPTTTDPFWVETELGVTSPDLPRSQLKRVEAGSQVRWLLGDDEVVAVKYQDETVPDAVKKGLRRFWSTAVQIHPDIATEIATSARMPTELWIEHKPIGKDPVREHWTLTSKRWDANARYTLAAHLVSGPTTTDGVFPDVFATLAKSVSEKAVPPTQQTYTSRAEAAIGRGAGLEAMLWIIEMNLAAGASQPPCGAADPRSSCTLLVRAGPILKADPRTAVAFANKAPDAADRPQFDNLPNAYLLRLLWATRPPGKDAGPQEGERDLLAALRTSPVANFCKDTGDFYAGVWQPFAAWQVWDFGRLMAAHTTGDLLDNVDKLEANLVTAEPAFF
jgi:hypothetical protein